jgi:phosphoglycerate dehydrogenase-like enzyme
VNGAFDDETVARIRAVPGAKVEFFSDRKELEARADEAQVIASTFLHPDALARATRLEWVQTFAAGPDEILSAEMIEHPVPLTSAAGNGAIPLAEHGIWQMLMFSHDALRFALLQTEHKWDQGAPHGELNGLTVGIIGLGHSGQDLALKAKAFHMNVLGMRRTAVPTPNVDEVFPRERLHELLSRSDFVVVTAPLTFETRGLMGEDEFRAMKDTAVFCVYSRGGIADDAALLRALNEGWIAGAAIDAFDDEPLPPDSPFWTAPNTICTPHAGARTLATRQRGVEIFIDNLERFLSGRPLVNVVDKKLGY